FDPVGGLTTGLRRLSGWSKSPSAEGVMTAVELVSKSGPVVCASTRRLARSYCGAVLAPGVAVGNSDAVGDEAGPAASVESAASVGATASVGAAAPAGSAAAAGAAGLRASARPSAPGGGGAGARRA